MILKTHFYAASVGTWVHAVGSVSVNMRPVLAVVPNPERLCHSVFDSAVVLD